jgi:hypothetical protein
MKRSSISLGNQRGTPEGKPFISLYKIVRSENKRTSHAIMEPRKVRRMMVLDVSTRVNKKPIGKIGLTIIGNDKMV